MDPAAEDVVRLDAQTVALEDIVAQLKRGEIRVPSFQRLFRWNDRDIIDLFDSITHGYPVGTLLLWRRPAEAGIVRYGPVEIDAPMIADARWVIDGQQRLTSFAGVLLPDEPPEDARFRVYYDLRDGVLRRRGTQASPAHWLPLYVVLDTSRLLNWLTDYPYRLTEPQHVDRATRFAKTLREYKIPTYIVTGRDEAAVRRIFQRSNRGGRPLRVAEVFDALHGTSGGGRPTNLGELGASLEETGFGQLDQSILLRALLACRGGDAFRDFEQEFGSSDEAAQAFGEAEHALRAVIGFLRDDCGFPHQRVVPYAMVVPTLARFFAVHRDPTPRSRTLLRRWVWRGAIVGIQPDGFTSALRRAVKAIDENEHTSIQRLLALIPRLDARAPETKTPRLSTASGRLAFTTLWSLEPRSLVSETPIEVTDVFETGMATVWPRDSRVADAGLANRLLHPTPVDGIAVRDLLIEADEEIRQTLAVSRQALDHLRANDVDGFLETRTQDLRDLQHRVWTERAEWDANDRPPISALVAAPE